MEIQVGKDMNPHDRKTRKAHPVKKRTRGQEWWALKGACV